MAFLTERKFSFRSGALAPDTFAVVDFSGEESLSRPYRFTVMLVTDAADIDPSSVLDGAATVTIHRGENDDVDFHGILSDFEQLNQIENYVFYRCTLVPRLWWPSLTRHNQVFLDKTVQEMVAEVLEDGGLSRQDFDFRLEGAYQKVPYACQYGETHLDFISRWLEREGIHYFFEQSADGEEVVFTDTRIAHRDSAGGVLDYAPPSGLSDSHRRESIQSLVCRFATVPKTVHLKGYNYEKPSRKYDGAFPARLLVPKDAPIAAF